MSDIIGQLLFEFMPCKYEYDLLILQKMGDYQKKHLEDDTWFRKKWITKDIEGRYLY